MTNSTIPTNRNYTHYLIGVMGNYGFAAYAFRDGESHYFATSHYADQDVQRFFDLESAQKFLAAAKNRPEDMWATAQIVELNVELNYNI